MPNIVELEGSITYTLLVMSGVIWCGSSGPVGCQRWGGLPWGSAVVPGSPPWSMAPGCGSLSLRILGSATQAELGAKRPNAAPQGSTVHVTPYCRNKHKQSGGGPISPICASWRGHISTCPHDRHLHTRTVGLSSAAAHSFMLTADARFPHITWQRIRRGVSWVEGISVDGIPRVTKSHNRTADGTA